MPNYLYNGVELPALPEYDSSKYRYAIIFARYRVDIDTGSVVLDNYLFEAVTVPFYYEDGVILSDGVEFEFSDVSSTAKETNNYKWGELYIREMTPSTCWTVTSMIVPKWTNTDIYNTDGTLYLAASAPIPILAPALDPLSLFLGWKAGNWVARQRGRRKQPVAYLYNRVGLPDINAVWTDKETYPYALIAGHTIDASETDGAGEIVFADLLLYKNAAEQGSDTSEHLIVGQHAQYRATNNQEVADIYGISELNAWCLHGKDDSEDATMSADAATWTSHDILNADGSVYLAASEPVPVYE